jgi:hypothetical protein
VILKQIYLPCPAHASYIIGDVETWRRARRLSLTRNRTRTNTLRLPQICLSRLPKLCRRPNQLL